MKEIPIIVLKNLFIINKRMDGVTLYY